MININEDSIMDNIKYNTKNDIKGEIKVNNGRLTFICILNKTHLTSTKQNNLKIDGLKPHRN